MLYLKSGRQILWADLQYIEAPIQAKRTLAKHVYGGPGTDFIHNQGGFNLPDRSNNRLNPLGTIESQIENGQMFVINRSTLSPVLNPVRIKENNKIDWSFRSPENGMLLNAMDGVMHSIQLPGQYTADHSTTSASKQTDKAPVKVIEKHQIQIKYELVDGANNPESYEIKLCVFNTNKQLVSMRQVMDAYRVETSKVFKLEQGETFKIYPMREHMTDVVQDFSNNKNFIQSENNGRIKALEIETSESIAGDVTLHTVTIKIPPILRMGCFFDGTSNDESNPVKYSNVQKLSEYYINNEDSYYSSKKYIRGVGSDGDGPVDKILGGAAGIGALERVAGMLHELEKACDRYRLEYECYPEKIQLDVFGFSRGATTARHFMNVLKQGFYGFNDQKLQTYITPKNIMFSFVGLFDSVGSYGIAGDNEDHGYNFHIRPQWLTDNAKVIHLIALNEYRSNFDLQTVFENQNKQHPENKVVGKIHEIGMIGAHSDVGGSYGPNEQGVVNSDQNPSQLSLMSLEKMYELAKASGVPLSPLSMDERESGLLDNHQIIGDALQDTKLCKLWMQWVEYKKYQQILEHRIEKYTARNEDRYSSYIKMYVRRLKSMAAPKNTLEEQMNDKMGNQRFQTFKAAYEHLEEYYIHESHGPFNSGIGMSAEIEEDELDIKRLTRTVFFKPAVDFEQVNKDLDRISYRRGRAKKVDIDEFDLIMVKEFK